MDYIHDLIAIVSALRWVLVLVAVFVLGALYADSLADRRRLRRANRVLTAENARLRAALAIVEQARRARQRRPVITGPVVS